MKAVVFNDIGDIRLENMPDPKIHYATDALLKIQSSAICGTDLHMIRGTMPGMKKGTILGHEAVGVVEEVGKQVRNLKRGDRVVVASTIACGSCSYCRSSYYSQCDHANPHGPLAGSAFFGGPQMSGPFDGLQAEYARIPYASIGLVKLPPEVSNDQAILISDIFPTAYFGAELAEIKPGDTVAVFGLGPVGLFSIICAKILGAGRVFGIDCLPDRLEKAQQQGAEIINFNEEDPIAIIRELTGGIGVDRSIDAVGVDAIAPAKGPAKKMAKEKAKQFAHEMLEIAQKNEVGVGEWTPGGAPTMALDWAIEATAKAGSIGIIGVYPGSLHSFPLGKAMNKNLTLKMGNCPHRLYIPKLIELVRSGGVEPLNILSQMVTMDGVIEAYQQFNQHVPGWIKVEIKTEKAEVSLQQKIGAQQSRQSSIFH